MRNQLVAISLAVSGCGSSGASGTDAGPIAHLDAERRGDAPSAIDAAPLPPDAAAGPDAAVPTDVGASLSCTIPSSLGTVTARSPSATREAGPPADLKYVDPLNGDVEPDVFKLVLIEGRGAFASGPLAPMTIQLGGVEAAYATCGACVEIFSNVNGQGNFAAFYLARSGTLTITSVSPRLTGTLSDVTFAHLDDNDAVVDACTTHLDSLAFDAPVEP